MDKHIPDSTDSVLEFEKPFRDLLPEFLALARAEILPVNLSIPAIVTTGLGVQPVLELLKQNLTGEMPSIDADLGQRLRAYAMALRHAETLYRIAARARSSLPDLNAEGMKLRSMLLADAKVLVQRGQIDGRRLRGLRGHLSYHKLAFDLQVLAHLFRGLPASIRRESAESQAEILRADQLAMLLLQALGSRNQELARIEQALDVRNRAFTLFVRKYDEARRAVAYLRWHEGDADDFVPSLYEKHRRKPRKKREPAPAAVNTDGPVH